MLLGSLKLLTGSGSKGGSSHVASSMRGEVILADLRHRPGEG